tara:strand:- start:1343 stop:1585 length:243 start_codon:yes stop_codon:yes gene_type:complete
MFLKFRLLTISISSGVLLILVLCLGSQNLNARRNVNLGIGSTPPLPTGFLVGLSIAFGVVSGGITKALTLPNETLENKNT